MEFIYQYLVGFGGGTPDNIIVRGNVFRHSDMAGRMGRYSLESTLYCTGLYNVTTG